MDVCGAETRQKTIMKIWDEEFSWKKGREGDSEKK